MTTNSKTKAQIRADYGDPKKTLSLSPSSAAGCIERWFYSGTIDIGLGPIEVLVYVDFDGAGNVCKPPPST
jgi:hypothetical protein